MRARNVSSITASASSPSSGAWILLAALEKSIEAQGVHVAELVSAFEVLLPSPDGNSLLPEGQQHETEFEHSNDPAFFSLLPKDVTNLLEYPGVLPHADAADDDHGPLLKRQHVVDLLYATRHGRRISLSTLRALLQAATRQNRTLPNVVSLPSLEQHHTGINKRVTVVGDLHGSLSDLEAVLSFAGEPSADHVLVFNGDLADRGEHGIEVIAIVAALLLAYPNQALLQRGNHEDVMLSIAYGLALECRFKYGKGTFSKRLAPLLDSFFRSLPLATVVQGDALIVHGGPPPPGVSLEDISKLDLLSGEGYSRTVRPPKTATASNEPTGGNRVQDDKINVDVIEALLWSDPSIDEVNGTLKDNSCTKSWKPNKSRGAGYKYDSNIVRNFLAKEGLFRLIRSHEPVQNGCVLQTGTDSSFECFTVFSASRYPNKEGFNRGASLTLLPDGKHRITRYDTEDDEPVMDVSNVLTEAAKETNEIVQQVHDIRKCDVDSMALRRALSEAIAAHRSQLEQSLNAVAAAKNIGVQELPFHDAIDVLIDVLQLEGEGLCQRGPRLALAKALSKQCHTPTDFPETLDLVHALDECLVEHDKSTYKNHLKWLHSIFSLVDANDDGVVSKSEWDVAVAKINARVPDGGLGAINADETWAILDLDHDGFVTVDEWDTVLLDVSLTRS